METTKSGIMVDKRMMRFIQSLCEWQEDVWSVTITDLDETFWFTGKEKVQEFLNNQVTERFGDRALRKGYFDYVNDHQETERYIIEVVLRGKIVAFRTEILNEEEIIEDDADEDFCVSCGEVISLETFQENGGLCNSCLLGLEGI